MHIYRHGGFVPPAPGHEELLLNYRSIILWRVVAHLRERVNLATDLELLKAFSLVNESMSFVIVIPASPPDISPRSWFVNDLRLNADDRVEALERLQNLLVEDCAKLSSKEDNTEVVVNPSVGLKIARAVRDLAFGLASARETRLISVAELAARTGVEAVDIEMLEEGDTSDLSLLLRVIDALDADVRLGGGFQVSVDAKVAA